MSQPLENSSDLLVHVSSALLEVQGEIFLKLQGNCMWPVLRGGDTVRIQKTKFSGLKFGDAAIFQTTSQTLHANLMFSRSGWGHEPKNFIGQITEVHRNGKTIILKTRSRLKILIETSLCPSNPYLLGLPAYLFRKLRRFFFKSPD